MTTQTLIWYTPEEKTPEFKGKLVLFETTAGYEDRLTSIPKGVIRWAYLDKYVNVPVMFGEWLVKTAWEIDMRAQRTHTIEQPFQEFLKTL